MGMRIRKELMEYKEEITELRRKLHTIPECAFEEEQTSDFLYAYLKELKPDSLEKVIGTGIKAVFLAPNAQTTIAVRADIDALPVSEENDCAYKSLNNGEMHACGHDGHMAMALVTAKIVSRLRHALKHNVVFLFQPAEEAIGGAEPMVKAGVLQNPTVNEIYALHLAPELPLGTIGLKAGTVTAAMSDINIEIKGFASHGAKPQQGRDALVAAAHFVALVQSVISRNVAPKEAAVITIGKIMGGKTRNVICDYVLLEGTMRTYSEETSALIMRRIDEMLGGLAQMFAVETSNTCTMHYPSIRNAQMLFDKAVQMLDNEECVIVGGSMVSEDFSFFQKEVPGLYAWLGIDAGEDTVMLHSSVFDFDEAALLAGVEYYLRVLEIV